MKIRRFRFGKTLLFCAYACGAASALAEGVTRATYRAPWYQNLYEEQARTQTIEYRINGAGLRDGGPFRGHNAPDLWVSAYDQHPTRAHLIAANAMLPLATTLLFSAESEARHHPRRDDRSRVFLP